MCNFVLSNKNKINLIEENSNYKDLLFTLFCEYKQKEFKNIPLDKHTKKEFFKSQFELRNKDYLAKNPKANFLIITRNKKPIGRLVFSIDKNIHIIDIAILREYQNKKIGTTILNDLLNFAKDNNMIISLNVMSSNTKAIDFYQKLGFNIVNTHNNYHRLEKDFTQNQILIKEDEIK